MTKLMYVLVDDDIIVNMVNRRVLQIQGISEQTFSFSSATPALDFIFDKHGQYDGLVILLDINMPGIDGWAFLEQVRQWPQSLRKKIRIFMLSSSVAQDDIDRAARDPLVEDYLIKPLSIEKCQFLKEHPRLMF